MEQKYYKILTSKNTSLERGFDYTPYLPENGNPGKETPFIKDPIPGSEGYHVTPNWLKYLRGRDIDNIKIYEVETIGEEFNLPFNFGKEPAFIISCSSIRLLKDVTSECKTLLKQFKEKNQGSFNIGENNTGNTNEGDYNSGNSNKGDSNTGSANTGNHNTGNFNSGSCNSGCHNTGNYNTGYANLGNYNAGIGNIGDKNSGSFNVGSFNVGDFNIGNRHVGYFNIGVSDIKMFNKEIDIPPEDIQFPRWITVDDPFSSMFSKRELRTRFEKADIDDICHTIHLPNFNYAIFEKITGISKEDFDKKLNVAIPITKEEHEENGTETNQDCIELKPCPFCGSKNIELSSEEYHDKDVFYIVSCNNCGAQIEGSGRNKEAAEAWNTRCK